MKHIPSKQAALAVALMLMSGAAIAQSTNNNTSNTTGSSNPPLTTTNTASSGHMVAESALEKGSNSFTEGEAASRLQSAGLSNVTGLKQDNMGIWRGQAMRDGKSVNVGLDYKGSIAAE